MIPNIKTVFEIWVLVLFDIITARELLTLHKEVHCSYRCISPHIYCCRHFHPHHIPVRIPLDKYKLVYDRDIRSNRQFRYPSISPYKRLSRFSHPFHIQGCILLCINMEVVVFYRDMVPNRLLRYNCIAPYKHLRRFFRPHHILVRIQMCKDNLNKDTCHRRPSSPLLCPLHIHSCMLLGQLHIPARMMYIYRHRKGTGHHKLSQLPRSSLNIHYCMSCCQPHKHMQESSDMHI